MQPFCTLHVPHAYGMHVCMHVCVRVCAGFCVPFCMPADCQDIRIIPVGDTVLQTRIICNTALSPSVGSSFMWTRLDSILVTVPVIATGASLTPVVNWGYVTDSQNRTSNDSKPVVVTPAAVSTGAVC